MIASSDIYLNGSKFSFKVPSKIKGSYGITEKRFLIYFNSVYLVFLCLMYKFPSVISIILDKARVSDVFPAPVLPTIPIFSPFLTLKVKSFKTGFKSCLYLK